MSEGLAVWGRGGVERGLSRGGRKGRKEEGEEGGVAEMSNVRGDEREALN